MQPSLARDIAYTLEAPPALLPFLPELLADCLALGSSPEAVCDVLRPLGLPRATRALDLGCGKGAVALQLAQVFGWHVLGVDGFAPFVEAARHAAHTRGLTERCHFVQANLRTFLPPDDLFDVLVFAALGDLLGRLDETVGRLREAVRPGGYLVIDDAFLRDGEPPALGYASYASREETRQRLTAWGDALLRERIFSPEVVHAVNQRTTAGIRQRAAILAARHPRHATLLHAYVERQERECALLEHTLTPALWVLHRLP